jgi:hypothetical protein
MKTTKLICLAVLALASCAKLPSQPPAAPTATARAEHEGAWNGGKLRAPVSIDSEPQGPLEPGVDVPLRLKVTPHQSCTALRIEVQGLQGAFVSGGEAREHGARVAGEEVVREVKVRLSPGASGLVAVTASMEVEGRLQSSTVAIPMEPRGGVDPRAQKPTSPMGQVEVDAEGHPLILMESHGR